MTDKINMPSDWHIQEAIRRTPSATKTVEAIKENPHYFSLVIAHARTLAEFLPEPQIDPDLEALKRICEAWMSLDDQLAFRSTWDQTPTENAAALAQYKAEIAARLEGMQPKIERVALAAIVAAAWVDGCNTNPYRAIRAILDHLGIDHD